MSFISIEFIIFALIVIPLYFVLELRWRILLLLIASYVFYAFTEVAYIGLIGFSTIIDFLVSNRLGNLSSERVRQRQALLLLSIVVNLGVLFTFKYFNFFSTSFTDVFGLDPYTLQLILPVGISFYTFQSMAYTIDVYRGLVKPEHNLAIFATYVAFFPQLVAGPIERAKNLLPQFHQTHTFDYDRVVSGLRLIAWGIFKKVVIADRLAIYVNGVYNDLGTYTGLPLIVATFFFTFQIYCDFSGYSDIAIGLARIMGFKLMDNFRQPYFSTSISEFWRRWHISLSTWFRDYVYIPLGGNRVPFLQNLANLFIVFLVSGLWHGAEWTFVVWGAIHGGIVVVEAIYRRFSDKPLPIPTLFKWVITFAITNLAWIFFRANNLDDAMYVLMNALDFSRGREQMLQPLFNSRFDIRLEFVASFGFIFLLLLIEFLNTRWEISNYVIRTPIVLRWALYYTVVILVFLTLINVPSGQQFIYFQF